MSFDCQDTLDTFTTDGGVRFDAVDSTDDIEECKGCAFYLGVEDAGLACADSPLCGSLSRNDGRNVIWVRSTAKAEPAPTLDLAHYTRKVLMLSTAHVTKVTADALTQAGQARKGMLWRVLAFENWAEYGWLVYAHDEVLDQRVTKDHPDLMAIFKFAHQHGFGYVWLDCDWEPLPPEAGLPKYEW